MSKCRVWVVLALLLLPWSFAHAHGQSTALLQITSDSRRDTPGRVQIDVALLDLQQVIGLDRNADAAVSWGELQSQSESITRYVSERIELRSGPRICPLGAGDLLVDTHADGVYAVLVFTADCIAADRELGIDYRLLFDANASHRALASWTIDGRVQASGVIGNGSRSLVWSPTGQGFFEGFAEWVWQGVWHIWVGVDHLLFIATLLLPAMAAAKRRDGSNATLGAALLDVARVVTAFTVSHSLTLVAGTLGWLHFEARWVESAIAATVLFGAVNLVVPLVRKRLWALALGFGLVHGLGFASVLAGLGLDRRTLLRDLLGFNLGVELGQLAVVALLVPLVYSQRDQRWYRTVFTPVAAMTIGVVAVVWVYQRVTPA
jgi:hypothetical protein